MKEELLLRFKETKDIQEALKIKKSWELEKISPLKEKLSSASLEEKKKIGREINALKKDCDDAFEEFKTYVQEQLLDIKPLDLSVSNYCLEDFSFNPLSAIRSHLIHLFDKLNFHIESGKEFVSTEENFEDLMIPLEHPSRSKSETFYLERENYILRPHCTVNSVSFLKRTVDKEKSAKCATIGVVYRKDDESTRHTHQFNQLDFVWVSKDINLTNLKWFLRLICKSLFGDHREYRFRYSYFPFTAPSLEMDMKCNCSDGKCNICKGSKWIEILGAGMLRSEILEKCGYSSDYSCIAGGIGLERLALIKYGIDDIRKLYENNFLFLKDDR